MEMMMLKEKKWREIMIMEMIMNLMMKEMKVILIKKMRK